ncbi:MAG: rRNA maturation RNase YbeY [Bacteroidetes bacterium]|nr:rRNA maturation RNase YbeY [Bacteroidota bacterium]
MSQIVYFGKRNPIAFLQKDQFLSAIIKICQEHHKTLHRISYVIVSDEKLLEINQTHLEHDYYTDIITFDLSDTPNSIDAEIYISSDRVKENAKILGSEGTEMLRVMFHGVLHLCGFNDHSEPEKKAMREQEAHCLNLYHRLAGQ